MLLICEVYIRTYMYTTIFTSWVYNLDFKKALIVKSVGVLQRLHEIWLLSGHLKVFRSKRIRLGNLYIKGAYTILTLHVHLKASPQLESGCC